MILVIMGHNKESAEQYIDEMMVLFASRTARLSAHHLTDPKSKLAYLQRFMTHYVKSSLYLTLIPHCYTKSEMDFYRQNGAYVAHIYGALSAEHSEIEIQPGDLMVRPVRTRTPSHAYSQTELMSELIYRHRKIGRQRDEHRRRINA